MAEDTGLPVERDFYAPGGTLFKSEYFEDVKKIDGILTVTRIVMKVSVQAMDPKST